MLKNKKLLYSTLAIFLVLCLGFAGYLFIKPDSKQSANSNNFEDGTNYSAPTQEEKNQADQNKDKNDTPVATPEMATNEKQTVKPTITVANSLGDMTEAAAAITNIFEKDGLCTFIYKNGSEIVEKKTEAVAEGRSTFCPIIQLPNSEFKTKGIWELTVDYESSFSSGESDVRQIEIN